MSYKVNQKLEHHYIRLWGIIHLIFIIFAQVHITIRKRFSLNFNKIYQIFTDILVKTHLETLRSTYSVSRSLQSYGLILTIFSLRSHSFNTFCMQSFISKACLVLTLYSVNYLETERFIWNLKYTSIWDGEGWL